MVVRRPSGLIHRPPLSRVRTGTAPVVPREEHPLDTRRGVLNYIATAKAAREGKALKKRFLRGKSPAKKILT
jgi:hypothetical protein